jgi:hypothetical protein
MFSKGFASSSPARDRTAQPRAVTALLYTAPGCASRPCSRTAASSRRAGCTGRHEERRAARLQPSGRRLDPAQPPAPGARVRRGALAARGAAGPSVRVELNLAHAPAGRRSRGRRCWTPDSCGTRAPPRAGWGSCTCAPPRAPAVSVLPRRRPRPRRGSTRLAGRQRAASQLPERHRSTRAAAESRPEQRLCAHARAGAGPPAGGHPAPTDRAIGRAGGRAGRAHAIAVHQRAVHDGRRQVQAVAGVAEQVQLQREHAALRREAHLRGRAPRASLAARPLRCGQGRKSYPIVTITRPRRPPGSRRRGRQRARPRRRRARPGRGPRARPSVRASLAGGARARANLVCGLEGVAVAGGLHVLVAVQHQPHRPPQAPRGHRRRAAAPAAHRLSACAHSG